ncbi:MAG TPA: CsbD family protein [Candidatus Binatia bacterium]
MNWDQIEGKWKELTGGLKEHWGKLTDDELQLIGGKREKLAGLLQQKYGIAKEAAEAQIAKFEKSLDNLKHGAS